MTYRGNIPLKGQIMHAQFQAPGSLPEQNLTQIQPAVQFLKSRCWCDTKIVDVPQPLVARCKTLSCGRSDCKDPTS